MTSAVAAATTFPCPRRHDDERESRAALPSMPVPTNGASEWSSGTPWRCMFDPMSARLASSCSRKGISEAAIETSCFGETSM